jgi:YidC/Oxa1 family membrane protein insertase
MANFFSNLFYYPFLNLLVFVTAYSPGHNAAWAIVIATLLVRLALLIPSKRSAQSQRRMNEMQPLIEELKKEYGDDKQGLSVAQMELYKQNNINPFASCLPLLIQLPVLIFFYRAIISLNPNGAHIYSFVPKFSDLHSSFFGINLLKPDHYYFLPVIASVLQFFQIRMTMPKLPARVPGAEPDPTQMVQRNMMYISPLLTMSIAYRLPAGAALYWVISTGFSIIQQYYVNKEKLKLTGVTASLKEVERKHPEHTKEAEKAIVDLKSLEETTTQKGVSITVRRKSK